MGIKKTIAPISKNYPGEFRSLESSLSQQGFFRSPGSFKTLLPFKGLDKKYYTGLDTEAHYLSTMPEEERKAEIERIQEARQRLEQVTGLDLSPRSLYYNYAAQVDEDKKVTPVKLGNKEVPFNLEDPLQEITWHWIRVHPSIAPSLRALQSGEVNYSMVQYYISDGDVEDKTTFSKKQAVNKAIVKLLDLSPDKLKRIGRLMGLPITDNTTHDSAYNQVDSALKEGELKFGANKGSDPVVLFSTLLSLAEDRLEVKDLVDQAIASSIYRVRGNDRLYEGENEIAATKEELVNFLLVEKNQEDLFALQKKLKINKIQTLQ